VIIKQVKNIFLNEELSGEPEQKLRPSLSTIRKPNRTQTRGTVKNAVKPIIRLKKFCAKLKQVGRAKGEMRKPLKAALSGDNYKLPGPVGG